MPWKRMLAYITGRVNEDLLRRITAHRRRLNCRQPPVVSIYHPPPGADRSRKALRCPALSAGDSAWPRCLFRPTTSISIGAVSNFGDR
jgi:hypothetical protein